LMLHLKPPLLGGPFWPHRMASVTMSARAQAPHRYAAAQHLAVTMPYFAPKPATAVVRAHSFEPAGSRGPSLGPAAGVARYTGLASPPVSNRNIYPAVASPPHSHRSAFVSGEPVAIQRAQRPQAGRYTSRSPPPQRLHSGNMPRAGPEQVCIAASPACTPHTPAPMRVSRPTSVPSTQSLGSAASVPRPSVHSSAPSTQATVPAMPAARAHSASCLPVSVEVVPSTASAGNSPSISSMPTLTAPSTAPPLAQVLHPHTARHGQEHDGQQVAAKLEEIHHAVQMRRADDLEHTANRQRVQTLESTVQLKEKELREVEETMRTQIAHLQECLQGEQRGRQEEQRIRMELEARLQEQEARLQEQEQRYALEMQQAKEDHDQTHRNLMRAKHNYDTAEYAKGKLEARVQELERSEQELQERSRMESALRASAQGQAAEREKEIAGRLAMATEAARRLEGEKRVLEAGMQRLEVELQKAMDASRRCQDGHRALEAEIEKEKSQRGEAEQESRELRCRLAVSEDEKRCVQERNHELEQEQQKAVQDAVQDSNQWHQKLMEGKKENGQLAKAVQDLKADLWNLETQLRQERNAANICRPGELLKLVKANSSEHLAENDRLKRMLKKTHCDLELCMSKIQEMDKEREGCFQELQHVRACQRANAGA